MKTLVKFLKDEEGVTAVEYGLIAALIAGVIILVTTSLGNKVSATFQSLATAMPT